MRLQKTKLHFRYTGQKYSLLLKPLKVSNDNGINFVAKYLGSKVFLMNSNSLTFKELFGKEDTE